MPVAVFVVLNVAVLLAAAVFWEGVAWFMHKYVMHGVGWVLHEDHHRTHGRRFQRNDAYALFFATCSFLMIFFGLSRGVQLLASAGFGVALYGIGYVSFHDVMFHRRIKAIKVRPKNRYLRRITNAHRTHHSTTTREGATSFSFLWAPRSYADPRPADRSAGAP